MSASQDSDAAVLWDDVMALLAAREDINRSTVAMIESCVPTFMDDESFHVSTTLGFAQRKITQHASIVEACLEQASFQHLNFVVDLVKDNRTVRVSNEVSPEELSRLSAATSSPIPVVQATPITPTRESELAYVEQLRDEITQTDSKLTFERFVAGEENRYALEAAKQVANGYNTSYNPLFIYGKSGLGKTHLLRAIQNYIAKNDPSRRCIYRAAADFVDEYVMAATDRSGTSASSALAARYQNVDVLIIDDIQNMMTAGGTIRFFFKTFNSLMSHNKQIVLAADRSPSQLGMGDSKFDERDTSRMDSGLSVSIQVPDYELKLNLINAFYERMRQDAIDERVDGVVGTIPEEMRRLMAERAGTNIRVIEGFVQSCLMQANRRERAGQTITRADIIEVANQKWPTGQRIITVDHIQKLVEKYYDVAHADLIGSKRNKELMEARHVGIWLTRELTDNTLAEIGKKFGGRTHATVKHSIAWVDDYKKRDRIFHDRIETLRDSIVDGS
ncbi:MAG: DnaA/Hda family protein [Atopobiaceae bacterium]|nr:DnaA/Hda family protein [Atopobiaceae bacterium]